MSKTETQSKAESLANMLEFGAFSPNLLQNEIGVRKGAAAELRRLDARVKSLEFSFNEWHDKTDWVQDTAQALELGMHRADVLRARIESLDAENKALRARLEIDPSHPIDGIAARDETIRQLEAQIKGLRADANRYRWLRANAAEFEICVTDATGVLCGNRRDADLEIDACIVAGAAAMPVYPIELQIKG